MKIKRSYRRRGSPDLPISVHFCDARVASHNPIPEYHPETELVRVQQGHVVLQLDGVSHTFREGDIFLIPGNTIHHYQHISEDAKYCCLFFSTDAIAMQPEHFFQKNFVQPLSEGRLQLPALLQPGHPAYDGICAQYDSLPSARMFTKDYQTRRFSALINICLLLQPYSSVISQVQPLTDPGNTIVRLCMRYIHTNYADKITLATLAQYCHVHPNYLCALFKSYTGQTFVDYLTRFRMETAGQLLKSEDIPAGKVCELVGYHSESHFYRKFKEIMGVSPKLYGKEHKNK